MQSPASHPRNHPEDTGMPIHSAPTTPAPPEPAPPAPKPKKSHWLAWLVFFCVVGVAVYLISPRLASVQGKGKSSSGGKKGGSQTISVVASTAFRGDLPIYLTGLGTVAAFNTVTVRTRVDGELTKVAFEEGQIVHKGDLLCEIDPRPFQVQLELAQGQMARDEAQLNNARVDLERYRVLFSQDAVPKQQLDTQTATVHQVEGVLKADQAQIDNAKLQLVYSHIVAPISGRIGLRLVDQGNVVHATDSNGLAVITQLQPIAVFFNIAEDSLPQAMRAMRDNRNLPVEVFDRDLKKRIARGTLLTIDNQIDTASGTLRFKGVFPNEDNALFPNQFVNARLLVDTRRNAVIVPTAAVQRGSESAYVYVVKPDQTADVRDVKVGPTEGDETVIASGVKPGDEVVIDGVDKLQTGTKVLAKLADAPGRTPHAATGQ